MDENQDAPELPEVPDALVEPEAEPEQKPEEVPAPEVAQVEEEVPVLPIGHGDIVRWTTSRGEHGSGMILGDPDQEYAVVAKNAVDGEERPLLFFALNKLRRG